MRMWASGGLPESHTDCEPGSYPQHGELGCPAADLVVFCRPGAGCLELSFSCLAARLSSLEPSPTPFCGLPSSPHVSKACCFFTSTGAWDWATIFLSGDPHGSSTYWYMRPHACPSRPSSTQSQTPLHTGQMGAPLCSEPGSSSHLWVSGGCVAEAQSPDSELIPPGPSGLPRLAPPSFLKRCLHWCPGCPPAFLAMLLRLLGLFHQIILDL